MLVVAAALLWPAPQAPHFERPQMAFQRDIPRSLSPGCSLPGGTSRSYAVHYRVNCSHLESLLRKVFNPADAVNDAKSDLERGAFRFIGRSAGRRSEVVIPGIEYASEGLRNALYDSTCVVVLRTQSKVFSDLDKNAKAYKTAP